jgi:peptidyl-dipeptidase Dcp
VLDPSNPLSLPSDLPFGLPDFARITPAHLEEALREGMAAQRAEWEAIATDPHEPTVENTVVAVDESGRLLERAQSVAWTMLASVGGPELERLQETFAPLLAEHAGAFTLDARLYRRYLALAAREDLDAETAWVVERQVRAFERLGVGLDDADQAALRRIDAQLASAQADMDARITRQLRATGLEGDDLDGLDGLDAAGAERDRQAGAARGHAWFIPCRNFTTQLDQAVLTHPETRRALLARSEERGNGEDPGTDTRATVLRLVGLRAERARLLGFADHASVVMDGETVPGPEAARELLLRVGRAAASTVDEDAADLARLAADDADGDGLQAADWPYYENLLRRERLGVDAEALRPYLQLDRVIEDGVFWAAGRLYGITMTRRPELRGWSPDARVWEVRDADGSALGLFVGDWFARPGKQGGAWMNEVVAPAGEGTGPGGGRTLPVIANNANFARPAPGQPALLTWDEVITCFHEFGHALHGFFSATRYREDAGTNVPRDFVEMPSQLNEMWAYHPEVLGRFARHVDTGEALPEQWRAALEDSASFGQGFQTLEFVQAALIDHAWHRLAPQEVPTDPRGVRAFEDRVLAEAGVAHPLVPPRYRSTYFAHAFAGGYDAGYYSYMWAEVLVAELEQWFRGPAARGEDGGLNRQAGETLRRELLSRGNSRDPLASFRAVRGHDADPASILIRRGLRGPSVR